MGRVKQQMFDDEFNQDMEFFLKQLDEREEISGAVQGIYKQLRAKGFESLSKSQKNTLDKFTESYKKQNVCEVCENGNISSLTDYIEIADNGICSMCEYDREKFMSE
ncbi:hypothetical protein PG279_10220 [Riemerella anatipestifer]|nr:hypothetical protein [Riemerella anatipestifer]